MITTAHELGNMTYGYLGSAMGWTELELLIVGKYVGGVWGVMTRSDSEEDKTEIRAGIQWYNNTHK